MKVPHTLVIVFALVVLSAVTTWIIPAGSFEREIIEVNGVDRTVVINDSFQYDKAIESPQTYEVFTALYEGFVDKADIIIFILIVGGAFWMLNATQSIDVGIHAFLRRLHKIQDKSWIRGIGVDNAIFLMIMTMFSLFGAVFGMSEETIAFTAIFVPLAIKMGYDSIVGVCLCYVSAHVGFAGAFLNPFTVGIAQGLSGLPIFSGIEYRIICWVVLNVIAFTFILLYARRVRRNPESSPMYKLDKFWRSEDNKNENVSYFRNKGSYIVLFLLTISMSLFSYHYCYTTIKIGFMEVIIPIIPILTALFFISSLFLLRKSVHFFIMNILIFTILFLIVGVLGYGWYIMEIAALFLVMGLAAVFAYGMDASMAAKEFVIGCKDILSAGLIVGLAAGIIIILERGHVMDTIMYAVSTTFGEVGRVGSVTVMYTFQTLLNLVMPSGSAKAALTMPIMSIFSDMVNVSRQTTVLAFQFGDGFTNMITPTSGVMMAVIGIAKIPYSVWFKWIFKLVALLFIIGFILLLPTIFFNFNGF